MSEPAVETTEAALEHEHEHEEHYDPEACKIGMWLFLTTEILLFGVLFITYAVYYNNYTLQFKEASTHLDWVLGGINTVVLLTSSMTMALAIWALQKGDRRKSLTLLFATLGCALGFLVIKAFEWGAKFEHGYFPNSEYLLDYGTKGENLFLGLYFLSTGLHAFHVIVGMLVISLVVRSVRRGRTHKDRISFIENAGLYWHLVDLIWIYLFPLYYLIHVRAVH